MGFISDTAFNSRTNLSSIKKSHLSSELTSNPLYIIGTLSSKLYLFFLGQTLSYTFLIYTFK